MYVESIYTIEMTIALGWEAKDKGVYEHSLSIQRFC
jgi:hypothetical protein